MRVVAGFATDIGQVRQANEDCYLAEPPLYAVADGMGGHRGGEVASHLALETLETMHHKAEGTLAEQVKEANRAVYARSSEDRRVAGMGTTLTAAVVDGDGLHLAHVGDSRAYLLRGGSLRQLTDDHTLVNRMVKAGEITRAEAEVHPHRNVVTRSIGTEPEVPVDEQSVALLEGDRILLCSDGLTGMVTEDQIQAILETTGDAQQAADRLVRAANRAGGIDNITAVVLDVQEGSAAEGEEAVAVATPRAGTGIRGTPAARRSLRKGGVITLIVLAVLGILAVGGRAYVHSQWYVGVSDGGHVGVFQGVPASPLGLHLSSLQAEYKDLSGMDVSSFDIYKTLPEGITANSQADAEAIVTQMRAYVVEQRAIKGGPGPTATPSASAGAGS
ncbi:MAG: Stp1/IreP family PP2C-type Ser/Thr phosphatase [Actinomycetota bacterium]